MEAFNPTCKTGARWLHSLTISEAILKVRSTLRSELDTIDVMHLYIYMNKDFLKRETVTVAVSFDFATIAGFSVTFPASAPPFRRP